VPFQKERVNGNASKEQEPMSRKPQKNQYELGIREPELHMLACFGRGPWPVSNYSLLRRALPNAYFDSLGLLRLTT
jgi:hypothetical protein